MQACQPETELWWVGWGGLGRAPCWLWGLRSLPLPQGLTPTPGEPPHQGVDTNLSFLPCSLLPHTSLPGPCLGLR